MMKNYLPLRIRRHPKSRPRAHDLLFVATAAIASLIVLQRRSDAPRLAAPKLVLVLPFTANEVHVLMNNIDAWHRNGPACSVHTTSHLDLGLFFHKTSTELPAQVSDLTGHPAVQRCFGRVQTLFAKLNEEEDIYPAGPSVMFFRIFKDPEVKQHLVPYQTMYWMELDTFPVKSLWLDKLYAESLVGDFWMKGSIYFGPGFDETVKTPANWDWVGHINGNALYRLNDPEFEEFLTLVEDVEPPIHFWKPFDISIWKVLHSFPYYWRIHQRAVNHFAYAEYIQHWGFTITQSDIDKARVADNVYLLHGRNTSAGTVVYQRKFKDGVPVTERPINWDGSIDARDDICVMLRSWREDLPYAAMAIKSIHLNMPNAKKIVMVVPENDFHLFQEQQRRKNISADVKLVSEKKILPDDHIQQKYSKMMADAYCPCKYIFHLDSDVVLMRRIYRKDMFFMGKPLLEYDRYSNLPDTTLRWKAGTSNAVGKPVIYEYSRSNNHLYPRDLYPAARQLLERRFGKSFAEFMATRIGKFNETHCFNCPQANPDVIGLAFSDFNYLGAYLWFFMHDQVIWQPLDATESKHTHMRPIIPPFVCQGNARLAHMHGKVNEEIRALQRAMKSGDCSEVIKMGVQLMGDS